MAILALEFSTPHHAIALRTDQGLLHEIQWNPHPLISPRKGVPTSALIDDALQQCQLRREDIDLIALGLGPGSYTGIRVAIALAQGWELAGEGRVQVLGISTLEVIAHTLFQKGRRDRVTVAFDAQKGELHLTTLDFSTPRDSWENSLHSPLWRTVPTQEWKSLLDQGELLVGPDLQSLDARITPVTPSAGVLAECAEARRRAGWKARPGTHWTPVYLRETTFAKTPSPVLGTDPNKPLPKSL